MESRIHFLKTCLTIMLIVVNALLFAQSFPGIQWQKSFGGNKDDILYDIKQTSDGGFILGGKSMSGIVGNKTEVSLGNYDYWVIKLDNAGNIQWQNTIGGSGYDELISVIQTSDGGYMVAGNSYSNISGDKTIGAFSPGNYDAWILKLDASGNIVWQKVYGGIANDLIKTVMETNDGGYILGMNSQSDISGNKTEAGYGQNDMWVIKINSIGGIVWQHDIGGNQSDNLSALDVTDDGGFLVAGSSVSGATGVKTEPSIGNYDYWILKLNALGGIEWQNTIGGNNMDQAAFAEQSPDGNYIIAGRSISGMTGDKSEICYGPWGVDDYWVMKLNSSGSIIWQNTIGGGDFDVPTSFDIAADNSMLIAGWSRSGISYDKTETFYNNNIDDYWLVRLDANGNVMYDKTIGGLQTDVPQTVTVTSDGGFVVGGYSTSGISGDKTMTSFGLSDYWIVRINSECIPVAEICNGLDDDCNGIADNGLTYNDYYPDTDGDGYGNLSGIPVNNCMSPAGYVLNHSDCDDANAAVHPLAIELCNSADDDCNGLVDDGITASIYYTDADDDGFGDNADPGTLITCFIAGYVLNNLDCNDENAEVKPGATEICNTLDDDCNGIVDDGMAVSIDIFSGGATEFCQGSSVTLEAIYTGTSVQWKKNGANIPGATTSTYFVNKSGTYSASTSTPCASSISNEITITVNKTPSAEIMAGGPTTFCSGGSVTLYVNPVGGCIYQWYRGATLLGGAAGTSYVATSTGNYKCRVTKIASGCYKNSNVIAVSVPCRDEIEMLDDNNSFSIYPNPNNGLFTISSNHSDETIIPAKGQESGLTIYNSIGEIIYFKQLNSSYGEINTMIDLANVPAGIYFVRIQDGNNISEQKLIIER